MSIMDSETDRDVKKKLDILNETSIYCAVVTTNVFQVCEWETKYNEQCRFANKLITRFNALKTNESKLVAKLKEKDERNECVLAELCSYKVRRLAGAKLHNFHCTPPPELHQPDGGRHDKELQKIIRFARTLGTVVINAKEEEMSNKIDFNGRKIPVQQISFLFLCNSRHCC